MATAAKIRTLTESRKWRHVDGGYCGDYFRISKYRGVKVLYGIPDKVTLKNIRAEFKAQKLASKTSYAPKPYSVVKVIFKDGDVRFGILMQHIIGIRLGDLDDRYQQQLLSIFGEHACAVTYLQEKLDKVGIKHNDLHDYNIICKVKKRKITKVYAIDFSPDFTLC